MQQLLSVEELGDGRATELLRRMKQLLGDGATSTGDGFLRELFLQRLPRNVQLVLAATSNLSVHELATFSDAVLKGAAPMTYQVDAIQRPVSSTSNQIPDNGTSPSHPTVDGIAQQVNDMTQFVAALPPQWYPRLLYYTMKDKLSTLTLFVKSSPAICNSRHCQQHVVCSKQIVYSTP